MAVTASKKQPDANLRLSADFALEWETVEERRAAPRLTDSLGLAPEDRVALGLSPGLGAPVAPRPDEDARGVLARALR